MYALLLDARVLNPQISNEDNVPWLRLETRLPDEDTFDEAEELQFALSLRDYASNVFYSQEKGEFHISPSKDNSEYAFAVVPISNLELREVMSVFLQTQKLFLECAVYSYKRELLFVIHAFWQNGTWTSWDVDTNIYLRLANEGFNV